ncbi:MAG: 4-hydroxy-tetrahydrodipicolinate synthase [Clostridia bacterium]|nr:4-hydroxy-tetrahydrodipicolinate synthase [Clostridia bacterium]
MKPILFRGVATALVTPFRDGKVDYMALRRLAAYQIDRGVEALVVCGTTGESPTLTALEKLRCVAAVVGETNGRVPVIAGTATNDTSHSAKLSRLAAKEGADAVLAVAPYYNRPAAEGLAAHFRTIAEYAETPVVLYNVPSRTSCDIPMETYEALADHPLIAGVKEASGSISKASELASRFKGRLAVYTGNDDQTLPALSVGAEGVISVVSNLFPYEMHLLCALWREGKTVECLALHRELLPLMKAIFTESNPIPVKAAMAELGFCSPEMRLPLTPAKAETLARLKMAMEGLLG